MNLKDMIIMCLSNLIKRKVRTLLTVVGVVIGTCAIVVMISLGLGQQKQMEETLAQMGDLTIIRIFNYGSATLEPLNDKMLAKIKELPQVQAVTPIYNSQDWNTFRIKSGKYEYSSSVTGIDMTALHALNYQVKEGELPEPGSDMTGVILVGEEAPYNFYNPKSRNGGWINQMPDKDGKIPDPFVNVMEDKLEAVIGKQDPNSTKKQPVHKLTTAAVLVSDWSKNPSPGYQIFMDVSYMKRLEEEYRKLNNIKKDTQKVEAYQDAVIKVTDMKNVAAVEEIIKGYGFETNSMETIRKPMEEQMRSQQLFLGGLGAISLLVAALGITNTMIMSIYERTREIGVMKVLGCIVSNIRTVFLMEAGTIGFFGGVLGVGISYLLSFLINMSGAAGGGMESGGGYYGGMGMGGMTLGGTSIIPWWLVVGALVFSTLVGLVSGFSPANRAVKISALTAIKQE